MRSVSRATIVLGLICIASGAYWVYTREIVFQKGDTAPTNSLNAQRVVSPEETCDRLAAHPHDPQRRNRRASKFEELKANVDNAIAACRQAARSWPGEKRFRFQFARALQANQQFAEAVREYEFANAQGYVAATGNLAHMYLKGQGIPMDYQRARAVAEQAARAGYPDAQFDLGQILMNGWGTSANYEAAYFWFTLAARAYPGETQPVLNLLSRHLSAETRRRIEAQARQVR